MGYYRRSNTVTPERQRKIDALLAAASARGVTLRSGDPLIVGGGHWEAQCSFVLEDGQGRGCDVWGIQRDEYEELLATFVDDSKWATWAHGQLGRRYHEDASSAYSACHRAGGDYGRSCATLLQAELERSDEDRLARLRSEIALRREEATTRYQELQRRRLIAADYDATLPTAEGAVREYLGRLTIRKE